MRKLLLLFATVVMTMVAMAQIPEGAKPGLFTVNEQGKMVYFSSGDLMYKGTLEGEWRFADELNETEVIDNTVSNYRTISGKWYTLFGWGTSGYSVTQNQMPYAVTAFNTIARLHAGSYGPYDSNLNETGDNSKYDNREFDWAWHNQIENGGQQEHLWRTLTAAEWMYLLTKRSKALKLRFYVAIKDADGIHETGLILLPDDWTRTDLFDWDYYFDNPDANEIMGVVCDENDYLPLSYSHIEEICKAGGVLLKISGARYKTKVDWNYAAAYWTATGVKEETDYGLVNTKAYCLFLSASAAHITNPIGMIHGINGLIDNNDYEDTPVGQFQRPNIRLAPAPLYYGMKIRPVTDFNSDEGTHRLTLTSNDNSAYFVISGDKDMQQPAGAGSLKLDEGVNLTITAKTKDNGMRFVSWGDGSSQNPIDITLNSDQSYYAKFEKIPQYTVTVMTNDPEAGSVTGGGTYPEGTEVTLTAVPNSGNTFLMWTDGVTEASRTITVTSNATYIAVIGTPATYEIKVRSNDESLGTVSGGQAKLQKGETVTLTATPKDGCELMYWKDSKDTYWGNKTELEWTVYGSETLTAYFRVKPDYTEYNVWVCDERVTSQNQNDILGDGVFAYDNKTNTLTVLKDAEYELENKGFVQDWGTQDIPLRIVLQGDLSVISKNTGYAMGWCLLSNDGIELTGNEYKKLNLDVLDYVAIQGDYLTISDGIQVNITFNLQNMNYSSAILLNAGASKHVIVNGSHLDVTAGMTNSPQIINGTDESVLKLNDCEITSPNKSITGRQITIVDRTPHYYIDYTEETRMSEDPQLQNLYSLCPVEGFGYWRKGSVHTITAVPVAGYEFVRWSDGVTVNERTLTMDGNHYLDPIIRPTGTGAGAFIQAMAEDPAMGTIRNFTPGWYNAGEQVSITAQPNDGYEFFMWEDGSTDNPFVFTVADGKNVVKVASFTKKSVIPQPESGEELFWVAAIADDAEHGSVSGIENGEGWFAAGTQLTLTATPATGWEFVEWSDGDKSNPRVVSVDADAVYEAVFEQQTFTVTFYDDNGTILSTQTVKYGDAAVAPELPEREGYYFSGWDVDFSSVTSDLLVTAQYSLEIVYYTVTFIGF
ncbi:MAG: InlB B-repeat-containing protein, partial [Paludibacteraceae bacterium]|nr:InlB B-repeat-containing protein [Paludibacteraceae bacterium]